MDKDFVREHFLDFIEGTLEEDVRIQVKEAIDGSEELKQELLDYKRIMELEVELAKEQVSLDAGFSVDVMERLEGSTLSGRFSKMSEVFSKKFSIPAAVFATAALAVLVTKGGIDDAKQDFSNLANQAVQPGIQIPVATEEPINESEEVAIDEKLSDIEAKLAPKKNDQPVDALSGVGEDMVIVEVEVDKRSGVEGSFFAGGKVNKQDRDSRGSSGATSMFVPTPAEQAPASQEAARERYQSGKRQKVSPGGMAVRENSTSAAKDPRADSQISVSDLMASRPKASREQAVASVIIKDRDGNDRTIRVPIRKPNQVGGSEPSQKRRPVTGGESQRGIAAYNRPNTAPLNQDAAANAFVREERSYAKGDNLALSYSPPPAEIVAPRDEHYRWYPQPVPTQSGEVYGDYQENKRTLVSDDPFSTFSLDVDTGSYTNTRRFLRRGELPPHNAVRIEEFINYFDYDYPEKAGQPFTVNYEIAPSPLDPERFLLKLGVKAHDEKPIEDEAPKGWNLTFLIDTSGSMANENRLGLVKRSLQLLVDRMGQDDCLSVVTYSNSARVVLPMVCGPNKKDAHRVINGLYATGGTNGAAGIDSAYRVAKQHFRKGRVNRVVLATDGDFNAGRYRFDDLMRLIDDRKRDGITITTLGVGTGNYKEKNLEQIANRGNGNYFYLDSFDEARRVFIDGLTSTMQIVAKDVKVNVEFNPKHVVEFRLIGYDNRKLRHQDFGNDAVDAGEIGAGHTVTALYELVLADSSLADKLRVKSRYQTEDVSGDEKEDAELGFVRVRYKEPEATSSKLLSYPVSKAAVLLDATKASDDFRFVAAVSYAGHILRRSIYKGNYDFAEIIHLAEGALGDDKDGKRSEFVKLMKNALHMRRF